MARHDSCSVPSCASCVQFAVAHREIFGACSTCVPLASLALPSQPRRPFRLSPLLAPSPSHTPPTGSILCAIVVRRRLRYVCAHCHFIHDAYHSPPSFTSFASGLAAMLLQSSATRTSPLPIIAMASRLLEVHGGLCWSLWYPAGPLLPTCILSFPHVSNSAVSCLLYVCCHTVSHFVLLFHRYCTVLVLSCMLLQYCKNDNDLDIRICVVIGKHEKRSRIMSVNQRWARGLVSWA